MADLLALSAHIVDSGVADGPVNRTFVANAGNKTRPELASGANWELCVTFIVDAEEDARVFEARVSRPVPCLPNVERVRMIPRP